MNLNEINPPCINTRQYCVFLLALILGITTVQLQAKLTEGSLLSMCGLILGGLMLINRVLANNPLFHRVIIYMGIYLIGFSYAQHFATQRLAQRLPITLVGQSVKIVGRIISIPETNQFGQRFLLEPDIIYSETDWHPTQIQVAVNNKQLAIKAGERWVFEVKLKPVHGQINPASFDLESWFLQNNIAATATAKQSQRLADTPFHLANWKTVLQSWRGRLNEQTSEKLAHHPYSGVLKALALGEQSQISAEQWWRFSQTGITHLISISGLHITMLAGLVAALTRFIWRYIPQLNQVIPAPKAAILFGVCAATAYFIISGMGIPSQRTIIMLMIASALIWQHRPIPLSLAWLTALAIVLLVDPLAALSIGFWLSFLSVGILLWACANRIHPAARWREWLSSQWAATLAMLPLLLFIFGQFPLVSPLANIIAIPLISIVITPLALLGLIDPSGYLLRLAADLMADCDTILQWCTHLPLATWQHTQPPFYLLPPALVGVMLILLPRGFSGRYLGGLLLLPLLIFSPAKLPSGTFRAITLDVGQGLSVLIQTRHHALLFDTGTQSNADRVILPAFRYFNIGQLDTLLLSHNDNDHIGGGSILLQRWPIRQILHSLPAEHPIVQANATIKSVSECHAGQNWRWDDVQFNVLWPPADLVTRQDNAKGCVIRVANTQHSILITADIGKAEESALLSQAILPATDVLIVPHHGSKSSSSPEFIAATQPKYAVFSAGFMNRFGHPKLEIIERYQVNHAQPLITSQLGAVHFEFGDQLQMKAERQIHPHYWYTMPNQ
ncbi:DNA internalization-related competence protein ComEC/Rec2 [Chitinibacter fontanus]|uniref:DNA internalization-related competence protein ComEC/Rec2 n=1 Tax=Chitinibacter fontanus TaxID=1737446 RepID=A0A7D5ZEM5_9NEIS|nr:DNA internalization-related competence protein ComEC/Rec2 [Chitinibacter fontanus]QLI80389.1 DNA internalization-related competence protein ComEC/Rec2 [Chitinibacter fontanus]